MNTRPDPAKAPAASSRCVRVGRLGGVVRRLATAVICWWTGSGSPPGSGPPAVPRGGAADNEQLFDRVLGTIHNNSILLSGRSGIGKSSVLLELQRRLPRIEDPIFEFFPVHVDLRDLPERRLFAALGEAIHNTFAWIESEKPVDHPDPGSSEYCHRDLIADLRRVVRALDCCSRRRVKVVLLIDGINRFNEYQPRTAQRLRGLFMTSLAEHLVMVAAGTRIDKRWEREGSPWYNFFEEIELDE